MNNEEIIRVDGLKLSVEITKYIKQLLSEREKQINQLKDTVASQAKEISEWEVAYKKQDDLAASIMRKQEKQIKELESRAYIQHQEIGVSFTSDPATVPYLVCSCNMRTTHGGLCPVHFPQNNQLQKDGEDLKEKIAEILRDNSTYSAQAQVYVIHGAVDKIYELIQSKVLDAKKEAWDEALSSVAIVNKMYNGHISVPKNKAAYIDDQMEKAMEKCKTNYLKIKKHELHT